MKLHLIRSLAVVLVTSSLSPAAESTEPLKKEKLQIVFCFGQSNMVGLAAVPTAWYLTQPPYVPPKDLTVKKTRFFDWNFYWSGARYYQGPRKAELDALIDARQDSRMKWRQRINGRDGIEWDAAWGEKPKPGRSNVYAFLDEKAEEEGIYKRIAEILDSKENGFTVDQAYAEMIGREARIKEEVERIRGIYLKDTKPEDFDAFTEALKEAGIKTNEKGADSEKTRALYAELAKKHLNLPIAKRTRIFGHGAIAGAEGTGATDRSTWGPLSVGYGGGISNIGPEYGLGITLERLVDAPILLVKCSWGNTSIADAWRAPSLDGVETPKEKANREAWNKKMAEKAKAEGREYTPNQSRAKTGELQWAWKQVMPQVDRVLADPGKFHPDYDPAVGYEVAGLVWFQGYSDKDNTAYGELLARMVEDFREKVKAPKMPVVCGTLGMAAFQNAAFSDAANQGMVEASQMPGLVGTMDVVNTAPFYPQELDLWKQVRDLSEEGSPEHEEAIRIAQKATSNVGFHYHGSAKFFLLLGDAMARSLANLMAGGEPSVDPDWLE
jgi:alpha-galactosidase